MPAFMYICGMVSFSRSFRVTFIFGFLVVLVETILVPSVVPLDDALAVVRNADGVVVNGGAEVVV